ncbi:MAG: glycosyltransferase family 4 protein [Candidatus Acidiferrales bacterium]
MRVLMALEHHFARGPDGRVYGESSSSYALWARRLEVFDEVAVLARVRPVDAPRDNMTRADGPGVSFFDLPDYHGPRGYLRELSELKRRTRAAIEASDTSILRLPGLVSRLAWAELKRLRQPYAVEVVGDPWDALGPSTWPSPLWPIFRLVATQSQKKICAGASAIHYLTQRALQRRYPPAPGAYVAAYSDALLDSAFAPPDILAERAERIAARATEAGRTAKPFRVGFIGSLAQMYKGPDVLLRAGQACLRTGMKLELRFAGGGLQLEAMQKLAQELEMGDRAVFLGHLAFGGAVRDFVDSLDLLVMPSRAEGLPGAMLEAMARGCPCLGSRVGGIPELLAEEDLLPIGDPQALAGKMIQVARDPERLHRMSARNLERVREFRPEALQKARREFYRSVRQKTEAARGNNGEQSPYLR